MKKIWISALAFFLLCVLCACGDAAQTGNKAGGVSAKSVSDVMAQQMAAATAETTAPAKTEAPQKPIPPAKPKSPVDIDLTEMNSNMVYGEVYGMMSQPDTYLGKTVRMRGNFALYQAYDENSQPIDGQIYFACVIPDATACCSQGLEFVTADERAYPDDYPELGTEITVCGRFETYTEGQYRYCHLVDAVLES